METKEERRFKREYYQRSKDKFKEYYESNKEVICNRLKERFQDIKKDKEKYEERLRRNKENRKKYRLKNKEKLNQMEKERYERNKILLLEITPEHLSPMCKLELIEKAVEFVERVEKRKGLVSFEELFGELLDIAFHLPSCNYDKKSVGEQMTEIWKDVKFFANSFKGKGQIFDYKETKSKNLCKYCESSPIANTNNCCGRCRTIENYLNKLDSNEII